MTALILLASLAAPAATEDPYLWLEEVDGEKAMAWVHTQNERTRQTLEAQPRFEEMHRQAREILNNESRIPSVTQKAGRLYNFWRDADHPRGIYRRTTLDSLRSDSPDWETVLDIDAMTAEDGTKWVFRGMNCLPPEHQRCLASLSPGGGDAVIVREFDSKSGAFVEGGFALPESKMQTGWRDGDSLFVATDFGPGTMTESGYPRTVRIWERGTPLADAMQIYAGDPAAVSAGAYRLRMDEGHIDLIYESIDFWKTRYFWWTNGQKKSLNLPLTADIVDGYGGKIVFWLTEDWTVDDSTYVAGSVLVAGPEALSGGEGAIEVLVRPDATTVVDDVNSSGDGVLVTVLDNVRSRLYRYFEDAGKWSRAEVPFPENGHINVSSVDSDSGNYFVQYQSFTTPPTLYFVAGAEATPEPIKAQSASFDGARMKVEQFVTTSADATKVPYFVVMRDGTELNGSNPTHIFSYGGFRNALTPSYSGSYEQLYGAYGKLWLERGGVFVLANIRGGGEFGPDWHAAALLENRHKSFEDFEAVAADLARRGITSPEHLGIEGRSNGGLLVGATMTRRPELYGAVICGVPLLDMRRYHTLLAGASWMAEFGDPDDPEQWAFIREYSPYQNLDPEADYPPVFFYTSTRDDRVHPGHARKMAARMMEQGHEVWYYENTEGGHGGSSTNDQLAYRVALGYAHLWRALE